MDAKEAEAWKRVACSLLPMKPNPDPHDGPCCHVLTEIKGKKRWVRSIEGCYCQNYDDAQAAAVWAEEMNAWLAAQEIMEREGLTCPGIEVMPGEFSGCNQSHGDCPRCGR